MLKGEPLFPNLRTIQVNDLENFLKHCPFLLSSKLEHVSATFPSSWESTRRSMGSFIQALVSFAPQINVLRITYTNEPLEVFDITTISHLTCLRALEINRLVHIKRTADIFSFLKALVQLEELRLTVEESAQTWSPAKEVCVSPAPDAASALDTGSSHLKSLQHLIIRGPSQIISEFLNSLGTPNLISLSLASTCWSHGKQLVQLCNEPLDASERQTGASNQPSIPQPVELSSQSCTDACTSLHHHEWNLTRWSKTLQHLAISSCDRTTFDLSSSGILKHEALKSLHIKGSITPFTVLLSPAVPTCHLLQTLQLSFPDANLTLFELDEIALRSPNLSSLSSSFYIGSESDLDSLAEIEPLSHQLEVLTMSRAILKDLGSTTLHYASKIAMRLHLLFPKLKQLNYLLGNEIESRFWGDVWYIMRHSQQVALYATQRPPLVDVGTMTASCPSPPPNVVE
jgi:hypothetical protein